MKLRNLSLGLIMVLALAGCSDDSYESVRHPEGESVETVKAPSDEGEEVSQETDNKEEENLETTEDTLTDGVEVRVEDTVNMRLAPSESSGVVGQVGPDDEILNLGETEGWTRVTANGQTGYIRSDLLVGN